MKGRYITRLLSVMILTNITVVSGVEVGIALSDGLITRMPPSKIQYIKSIHEVGNSIPIESASETAFPIRNAPGSLKTNRFVLFPTSCAQTMANRTLPWFLWANGPLDDDGQWVFFVNVGWHNPADASQIMLDKGQPSQAGMFKWVYILEMAFISKDNWRVRANISLDSNEMDDAQNLSAKRLDPMHIGVSLAFDYATRNQVVLDLGYGRSTLGGYLPFMLADSPLSIHPSDKPDVSDVQIVTAPLSIQF